MVVVVVVMEAFGGDFIFWRGGRKEGMLKRERVGEGRRDVVLEIGVYFWGEGRGRGREREMEGSGL